MAYNHKNQESRFVAPAKATHLRNLTEKFYQENEKHQLPREAFAIAAKDIYGDSINPLQLEQLVGTLQVAWIHIYPNRTVAPELARYLVKEMDLF